MLMIYSDQLHLSHSC